jgi:uncharacterized protein (TIGR02246 family)
MNELDLASGLPRRPEDWPRAFVERLNAGDLDGVAALYAEDAQFLAPSGETLVGREAIRPVLAELIARQARLSCRVVRAVTAGGGAAGDGSAEDIAVLYTDFSGETRDASGAVVPLNSRAIEVLRRQADGGWKLIVGDPQGRG